MKLNFKILALSFLSVLISPYDVYSCSCYQPKPSFCESIDTSHYIVEVVVTNQPQNYNLEVLILDNLALNISNDTILILGQDGLNCGEDMSLFDIGDTLILGLNNFTMTDAQNNETYDWYLNGCDINYLKVENGFVLGQIRKSVVSESIIDFKNSINDCIDTTTEVYKPNSTDVHFFPNPTKDILYLNASQSVIDYSVEIYNNNGMKILNYKLDSENQQIRLNHLKSGFYFIKLYADKEIKTFKIVKE